MGRSRIFRAQILSRAIATLVGVAVVSVASTVSAQFRMEMGTLTTTDTAATAQWDTVTLQNQYDDPLVFVDAAAAPSDDPGNVRVRNITATGFEVGMLEAPGTDGVSPPTVVNYLVVERGVWQFGGTTLYADAVEVDHVHVHMNSHPEPVLFPVELNEDVVLQAQIQTTRNNPGALPGQATSPWYTSWVNAVDEHGFVLALHQDRCGSETVSPLPEKVAWLVFEDEVASSFTDSDAASIDFETRRQAGVGWHTSHVPIVNFTHNYVSNPLMLLTKRNQTRGWGRFVQPTPTTFGLRVDATTCDGQDRSVGPSRHSIFAASGPFRIDDLDNDGDGVDVPNDNCPLTANPGQADVNNDGLGDACDCGDGFVFTTEACDDGNADALDGCVGCQIEFGYACSGEPSVCAESCGDGLDGPLEECDDGNLDSGDGCSSTCALETGFTCLGTGLGFWCTTECGDGLQAVGVEACDDGNAVSGDGCSSCTVEPGHTCEGDAPSVCTVACGDGLVVGEEACDDGNTDSGDGCDAGCAVEDGFTCVGSPSVCVTGCGDGVVGPDEGCDDGNDFVGDGCSGCEVDEGWACEDEPSACAPICGDGRVDGDEQCDDGNVVTGDGCDPACIHEEGWACTDEPSTCMRLPLVGGSGEDGCGCRTVGGRSSERQGFALLTLLALAGWRRRRMR